MGPMRFLCANSLFFVARKCHDNISVLYVFTDLRNLHPAESRDTRLVIFQRTFNLENLIYCSCKRDIVCRRFVAWFASIAVTKPISPGKWYKMKQFRLWLYQWHWTERGLIGSIRLLGAKHGAKLSSFSSFQFSNTISKVHPGALSILSQE